MGVHPADPDDDDLPDGGDTRPSPTPTPTPTPSAAGPALPSPASSGGAGVAALPPAVGPSARAEPVTTEPVGSSAPVLGASLAVLLAILAWAALVGSAVALLRSRPPRRLVR